RPFLRGASARRGPAAPGDGCLVEPAATQVSRHDLVVPGLGPDLENLRIACISDVHLHHGVPRAAAAALQRLAGERPPPDVVVLIGDICNRRSDLASLTAWARDARGTRATFATLGHWEHDPGIDRLTARRAASQAGVELLYNSNARVGVGPSALTIVRIAR